MNKIIVSVFFMRFFFYLPVYVQELSRISLPFWAMIKDRKAVIVIIETSRKGTHRIKEDRNLG